MADETESEQAEQYTVKSLVSLCGPFHIRHGEAGDITPRGEKARAMLALLATSPSGSRARIWLQDRLWSDRGREQGAANLRQTLSEIRKCLAPAPGLLRADRKIIGLDPALFDIRDEAGDGEFLEGADVRDEEFESWLAVERAARAMPEKRQAKGEGPQPGRQQREPVRAFIRVNNHGSDADRLVGQIVADCVALTLRETLQISALVGEDGAEAGGDFDIHLPIDIYRLSAVEIRIRTAAQERRNGRLIWSDMRPVRMVGNLPADEAGLLAIINQLAEALAEDYQSQAERDPLPRPPGAALHLALQHLFTMSESGADRADSILQRMQEEQESGLVLAWRAHLRAIRLVERHSVERSVMLSEGRAFCDAALRREPSNSLVLAVLANSRLILDGDVTACRELSALSIELNRATPLGWWASAAASLYAGRNEEAWRSASHAYSLVGPTRFRFWWDLQMALSAALTGRNEQAIQHAERAHVIAPEFRPPLRYLIALYSQRGDAEKARHSAEKLRLLEPDFSVEQMVRDERYPASLIRRGNLISDEALAQLR